MSDAELVITDAQFGELRRVIIASQDATEFGKKTVLWLLRKAKETRKPVSVSFPEDQKQDEEASLSVHDMRSSNGSTILHTVLERINASFTISTHDGMRVRGEKIGKGFTIWVAPGLYDRSADPVPLDMGQIHSTSLS